MKAPKAFEVGMTRLEDILAKMQSEDTTLGEEKRHNPYMMGAWF